MYFFTTTFFCDEHHNFNIGKIRKNKATSNSFHARSLNFFWKAHTWRIDIIQINWLTATPHVYFNSWLKTLVLKSRVCVQNSIVQKSGLHTPYRSFSYTYAFEEAFQLPWQNLLGTACVNVNLFNTNQKFPPKKNW